MSNLNQSKLFEDNLDASNRKISGSFYTSKELSLKVLQLTLFNDINKDIDKNLNNPNKLREIYTRIQKLTFFDPSSGCGNILFVIYQELCKIELRLKSNLILYSDVSLIDPNNLYGIEIDKDAVEISKKLIKSNNIIQGNALRIDWNDFPEIDYIIGNPPFVTYLLHTQEIKDDQEYIFKDSGIKGFRTFDYVSCWFKKCADYMLDHRNTETTLISTSTICKTNHAKYLMMYILGKLKLNINWAIKDDVWDGDASVVLSIINYSFKQVKYKKIYHYSYTHICKYINNYIMPYDLIDIDTNINARKLIQPSAGQTIAKENRRKVKDAEYNVRFVNGFMLPKNKYLYIKETPDNFKIKNRYYLSGMGNWSSEYSILPCLMLDQDVVNSGTVWHIDASYDLLLYYFGIMSSDLFYSWFKTFCICFLGIMHSFNLDVYNSFYWPRLGKSKLRELQDASQEILNVRKELGLGLNEMYIKQIHPNLIKPHKQLDNLVESLYSTKRCISDLDKVDAVMKMWEKNKITF